MLLCLPNTILSCRSWSDTVDVFSVVFSADYDDEDHCWVLFMRLICFVALLPTVWPSTVVQWPRSQMCILRSKGSGHGCRLSLLRCLTATLLCFISTINGWLDGHYTYVFPDLQIVSANYLQMSLTSLWENIGLVQRPGLEHFKAEGSCCDNFV